LKFLHFWGWFRKNIHQNDNPNFFQTSLKVQSKNKNFFEKKIWGTEAIKTSNEN
jgi:type IV secretory pathway VirB3-like protein